MLAAGLALAAAGAAAVVLGLHDYAYYPRLASPLDAGAVVLAAAALAALAGAAALLRR